MRQLGCPEAFKAAGFFKIVLIVHEAHMRAVDYRGGRAGLCLVLDHEFSSTRSKIQGLGRVGRWNEVAERYWTTNFKTEVQRVKPAKINEQRERLLSFVTKTHVN